MSIESAITEIYDLPCLMEPLVSKQQVEDILRKHFASPTDADAVLAEREARAKIADKQFAIDSEGMEGQNQPEYSNYAFAAATAKQISAAILSRSQATEQPDSTLHPVDGKDAEIERLRAELDKWRPLTIEEAQKAYDEAEAVPMSEDEINRIVTAALDPAHRPTNNDTAQMAREIIGLKKANALLLAGMESQAELMDGLKQQVRSQPVDGKAALLARLKELADKINLGADMATVWLCETISKDLPRKEEVYESAKQNVDALAELRRLIADHGEKP